MWRASWLTMDRVLGFGFCLSAVALVTIVTPMEVAAPKIRLGSSGTVGVSPQFFPNLLASVIGLLGLILALRGRGRSESLATGEGFALSAAQWARVAKVVAILIAYLLVLPHLGFLISTPLCLAVLMFQLGARNRALIAIIAISTTAAVHIAFRYGMKLILPEGMAF